MKLTMRILAEYLADLAPRVHFNESMAELVGLRFYDENQPQQENLVYAGQASAVLAGRKYKDSVLLSNGHNLIVLDQVSLETAVNEVLAAFDFYDAWERSLLDAIALPDAPQKMLDESASVFGGMLGVSSIDGRLIAHSLIEQPDESDLHWNSAIEQNTTPEELMRRPASSPDVRCPVDYTDKPNIYTLETGMRIICSYLRINDELSAVLYIQEKRRVFNDAYLELAETLCHALAQSKALINQISVQPTSSLFVDLLEGRLSEETFCKELRIRSSVSSPWVVIGFKSLTSQPFLATRQFIRILEDLHIPHHSFAHEGYVLTILSEKEVSSFLSELQAYTQLDTYAIGVSMPFSSWSEFCAHCRQVHFVIELNKNRRGVSYFREHAFGFIINQLARSAHDEALLHPALERLRLYDEKHHTELYITLKTLLRQERNVVATSRALHIHRNSLMNRITRIKELTDLHLEDPNERAYLVLSYMLADTAILSEEESSPAA